MKEVLLVLAAWFYGFQAPALPKGIRVHVVSTSTSVWCAPTAMGYVRGKQVKDASGIVSAGPVVDKIADGLVRYQVSFASGPSGWVLVTDIGKLEVSPPPAPVPVPAPAPLPPPPPVPPPAPAPLPPPPGPTATCTPSGSGMCRNADPTNLQAVTDQAGPGDVVIVRDGVYTGGSTILQITRSGTPAAWITFKAEHRGLAVIDGRNNASDIGVEVNGSYIRLQGFEIRGTAHYGIEAYQGHDVVVSQNHVHDIGHYCTSTSNGIVGINAYAPNLVVEQNVVHDIGRWANGQNGCSTSNDYWQNHDHGVYQGQGDNLIVRNNVFYNFTRGWAIQRYDGNGGSVANLQIVNNTFVGGNPNKDGQIILASDVTSLVIANNIFYQPTTAGIWFDTQNLSGIVSNNLTFGANLGVGSTSGLTLNGNLTGDPLFVSVAAHDFRLQTTSPAIGKGLFLPNVLNDLLGTPRPRSVGLDIGAYTH